MPTNQWTIPETTPELAEGAIQVWRIDLEEAGGSRHEVACLLEHSAELLSSGERERASRMRAGRPRNEFVAGRGCLRWLLGGALGEDPRQVRLATGTHGKPELRADGEPHLHFNVSHSQGVILLALSRAGSIGIDVEYVNEGIEIEEVAENAFSAADFSEIIRSSTRQSRLAAFYRAWTCREAVAKADGRGLTLSPEDLSVGSFHGKTDELVVCLHQDAKNKRTYFVREIEAGRRHVAALAAGTGGATVDLLRLHASLLSFGKV